MMLVVLNQFRFFESIEETSPSEEFTRNSRSCSNFEGYGELGVYCITLGWSWLCIWLGNGFLTLTSIDLVETDIVHVLSTLLQKYKTSFEIQSWLYTPSTPIPSNSGS